MNTPLTNTVTLSLEGALQQAVAHHQGGKLQEAEQLYRAVLQAHPGQAVANHNLGILAGQVGQYLAGLPYLKAALEANPSQKEYWLSYAEALLATGQTGVALNIVQSAVQYGFDTPEIQHLLKKIEAMVGAANMPSPVEVNQLVSLFNAGQYAEVESRARVLINSYPCSGFAWKVLGTALLAQRKDALPALQKATEFSCNDAEAYRNLGNAQLNFGLHDKAIASFRRALEINPYYTEAYNNLGNAFQDVGQYSDAAASYRRVLEINPNIAEAHYNLGNVLVVQGQFSDAEESFCRALEIDPNFSQALAGLSVALKSLGRLDAALAHCLRALDIAPNYAEAHINLGAIQLDLGHFDLAIASYRRALEINPDYAEAHSNVLFTYNFHNDHSSERLAEAQYFGEMVARKAIPYKVWDNVPEPDRCLRIGLVSGDFHEHPVGYFIEGVLAKLVATLPDRLEFIAYYNHIRNDTVTEHIKACCLCWHSVVGISDENLARRVREDGVDILIDISGHTANNRLPLFAWKPVPVQISWLGYFATTGVAAIDYVLADPWVLPSSDEGNFIEKIWHLPETRLCFTPPDVNVAVSPLPALSSGRITFGCFNNLAKITESVVALWAKVMHAVPNSCLFLKAKQLNEASVRDDVINRFASYGIGVDRLILDGFSPRKEYLAAYHRVDIALDPFPYTGGTTSVEGLWMGVPVLTLAGERFLSRQGVGLLMNAGLSEWIASDCDDYISRAVFHAGNLSRLATLRSGLRQQVLASALFDTQRFGLHFEAELREMWRVWCGSTSV